MVSSFNLDITFNLCVFLTLLVLDSSLIYQFYNSFPLPFSNLFSLVSSTECDCYCS
jgi:hypothetical protein